jgi:mannose/cellobiose epimerase-like protein (N-acyl-D-glucosamine 2-epimerase family)
LLEDNVWDKVNGGYFDACEQDWSPRSRTKSVSSQLAPLSGYLLYLYPVTRDQKYLRQAERITDTILKHMTDSTTGWVLETFDPNWVYATGLTGRDEINVGHNLEVAWSLLRLYMLNKREDYLQAAISLSDRLHQFGFDKERGFWFATIGNQDPALHSDFTYWWIQAYGNMFDLYIQLIKPDTRYLDTFRKGAAFWNNYFIDKNKGDTHLSVLLDGTPSEVDKANQFKASYHSVEHGFLNYLYLANWVNPKPSTLHFRLSASEGDRLYPLPIEESRSRIRRVFVDGAQYDEVEIDSGFVRLSSGKEALVEVVMQ